MRRRIGWLERKADELEREFADSIGALMAHAEANRMRRKARGLREALRRGGDTTP
jgi:hypothetical protein